MCTDPASQANVKIFKIKKSSFLIKCQLKIEKNYVKIRQESLSGYNFTEKKTLIDPERRKCLYMLISILEL